MSGIVAVTPGQVLYVHVGGTGGLPDGGYNGGGTGVPGMAWGGGGASDVRTVAGVGGSRVAGLARDRGRGWRRIGRHRGRRRRRRSRTAAVAARRAAVRARPKPGTGTAGGAGGCGTSMLGCGAAGVLGRGGDGGSAVGGLGGGGGGGGLFGGGGGAGNVDAIGGGAGGSSLVPPGGTVAVTSAVARVDIDPYTPPAAGRHPGADSAATPDPDGHAVEGAGLGPHLQGPAHEERNPPHAASASGRHPRAARPSCTRCLTCKGKRGKAVTTKPASADLAITTFNRTFPPGLVCGSSITQPGLPHADQAR